MRQIRHYKKGKGYNQLNMENLIFIVVVLIIFYSLFKWIKTVLNNSCFPVFSLDELESLKKEWISSSKTHEESRKKWVALKDKEKNTKNSEMSKEVKDALKDYLYQQSIDDQDRSDWLDAMECNFLVRNGLKTIDEVMEKHDNKFGTHKVDKAIKERDHYYNEWLKEN